MMIGLAFAVVAAAVGADRLTNIASIPVLNEEAWIGYVGSIDPSGGNADWDWGEVQDENGEWVLFEDFGNVPALPKPLADAFCASEHNRPFRRFLRFDLEHGTSNNHPESATSGQVFGYVLAD